MNGAGFSRVPGWTVGVGRGVDVGLRVAVGAEVAVGPVDAARVELVVAVGPTAALRVVARVVAGCATFAVRRFVPLSLWPNP